MKKEWPFVMPWNLVRKSNGKQDPFYPKKYKFVVH